jgi:hypothetical protein
MSDSRQHPRVAERHLLWYRLPWSRQWHQAETRDISAGGLSFSIPGWLWWMGLTIDVEIQLPDTAFRARARVARTRFFARLREIGVAFVEIPRYAIEDMRRFSQPA